MQVLTGFSEGRAGRPPVTGRGTWTRIIGLLAIVLLAGDSVFAEFLVQPMLVRRSVQPGKRVTVSMKLENLDPQRSETVVLTLMELSQNPDSSWVELMPDDPNLAQYPIRSCRSWISLPPNAIEVGPYKQAPFTVQIDVPAATRGFYFAAIVATTAPTSITNETGVVTLTEFAMVVPVVLEIQSLVVRHEVALTDVTMEYRPEMDENPAATFAAVNITNAGGTFSAVMPVVRLWGQAGGHWRKVSEMNVGETGILPGVKLHLIKDVGRPLASGRYRIEGFLYVDGKRGNLVQKEFEFKGDPRIVSNAHGIDVPLDLQPLNSFVQIVPGATRSASLQVMNGSEEAVNVEVEFSVPADMMGKSNSRGIRGDDLSCTDWVTVEPRRFTLKGYARTSLRILARMPKGAAQYPCYYGHLKLRTSYADGQPAGTKDSYVCVQNRQVPAVPVVAASVLTISETSPSRYMITGGYINGGETHVLPSCQGALSMAGVGGVTTYKRFLMSSEAASQKGILLPFEARSFSGVLDVSDVPPGTYFVTSIMKWPGGPADGLQEQRAILVTEQGGRKYARMTEVPQQVIIRL